MDNNLSTDAYCVCYLAPPVEPSEEIKAEAAAVEAAAGLADDDGEEESPDDEEEDLEGMFTPQEEAMASQAATYVQAIIRGKMARKLGLVKSTPPTTPEKLSPPAASMSSRVLLAAKAEAAKAASSPPPVLPPAVTEAQQQPAKSPPSFGNLLIQAAKKEASAASAAGDSSSTSAAASSSGQSAAASSSEKSVAEAARQKEQEGLAKVAALMNKRKGNGGNGGGGGSSVSMSMASAAVSATTGSAKLPAFMKRQSTASRIDGLGGTKKTGWAKIRQVHNASFMTTAWRKTYSSWERIRERLYAYDLSGAAKRLFQKLKDTVEHYIFGSGLKGLAAAMSGGPIGMEGQYGRIYSRVIPKNLNPVWRQYVELRLEGGELDEETGEYDNKHAPYTRLRIEVWDRDRFTSDDFIGEVSVRLCPLMDGRFHKYEMELTDPEGKCMADDGLKGSIKFELQYES